MSLKRIFKKRLSKKILSGVDMVKLGVLDRLAETFQGRYGNETADSLAAAVVNELFSETPSDRYAKEFLELNKDVVERELSNSKAMMKYVMLLPKQSGLRRRYLTTKMGMFMDHYLTLLRS